MTLTQFEELCAKVFAERLPVIRDASDVDAEKLIGAVMAELESVALSSGLEICTRAAYLLVLAAYDMALEQNAEALGVPAEYFESDDRHREDEAYMYLHERRCGLPARHTDLTKQ